MVASKISEDSQIKLIAPDEVEYGPDNVADNMKWSVNRYFDVITINGPQSGRWRLASSEDTSKAYVGNMLGSLLASKISVKMRCKSLVVSAMVKRALVCLPISSNRARSEFCVNAKV